MDDKPTNFKESLNTAWSSVLDIWEDFLSHVPLLIAGIVVLLITWGAAKLVNSAAERILKKRKMNRGFKDLLREIMSVGVWVLGFVITAVVVFPGMTPTKVLAGLGIGSVAVGFAFKDIVENFLAGFLILWRFPFDPGDFVSCGDVEGKIEEVTIRMTLIRQTDGELVVLPNAKLFKEPVNVLTSQNLRRTTIICGIAYDEDVDQGRSVMTKALESCKTVSRKKPIEIFAREFASSSINFEVTWWCGSTPLEVRESRDEVVAAVKRALDNAGIEIPFPYRTLTFNEPLHTITEKESSSKQNSDSVNSQKNND